jgi:hypothetical protein
MVIAPVSSNTKMSGRRTFVGDDMARRISHITAHGRRERLTIAAA